MSCWKKRKTENEEIKKLRLEEAVAACKNGKMSQAAASVLYHIPKTTIWRRLQQENKKLRSKRASSNTLHANVDKLDNGDENTYFEVFDFLFDFCFFFLNIRINHKFIYRSHLESR